jgi:predicted RNase H-like nuclease (RuvC/YqgF family)
MWEKTTMWNRENPGRSKFLQYDKYLLLKVPNDAVNYITINWMEDQKTSFEEMVKDLHPELRALLERFKKDGLTRREIKRLIKKIENLEKTLLEPEKISGILEEIASKILETKLKKKGVSKLRKII